MRGRFLTLIGFVALSACGAVTAPVATPSTTVATAKKISTQSLYAAEALYNVPAQAYYAADSNGTLPVAVKAKAKPLLINAYAALHKAELAYDTADVLVFNQNVELLQGYKSQLLFLLGK